jgi:DNA-binding response OmpR family regulator
MAEHESFARTAAASLVEADVAVVVELLARVKALLQRPAERRETMLSAGPVRIDRLTRTVTRGDRSIHLLPREYLLLEYMMRHRDQRDCSRHANGRNLHDHTSAKVSA